MAILVAILLSVWTCFADTTLPSEQSLASDITANSVSKARTQDKRTAKIGPGDLLEVEVYPDNEFVREVRIAESGTVTLPLVGTLQWSGLSIQEAEDQLESLLRGQYYQNPRVLVRILEAYSSVVSVLGAVIEPKVVPVYGASDMLKLLGAAGGFNALASGRLIVVRGGEAKSTDDVVVVDGRALLERGDMSENIQVMPGDTIFAPTAEKIYVFGQVKEPGSYDFSQGITLLRAITLAGGLADTAKSGSIEVLTRGEGDAALRREFDISDVLEKKVKDPVLVPDDIIVVPERFF